MSEGAEASFTATQLAHWGLLEVARRELCRDRLMAEVASPPPAVLAVLRQQWAQARGLITEAQLQQGLLQIGLGSGELDVLVARPWRWSQWCERHRAARVPSLFLARKAGLDQVTFWRLHCGDEALASELYLRLREGERTVEQLLAQAADGAAWSMEQVGPVAMETLPQDLAALLRVSEPGVPWPPRPLSSGGWHVLQLQQRLPATLDPELRSRLLQILGEEALAEAVAVEVAAQVSARPGSG